MSSDSGFWKFHQKGVGGGPRAPFRNLLGDKARKEQMVQDYKGGGMRQRDHFVMDINLRRNAPCGYTYNMLVKSLSHSHLM